ncbi:MAG: tRNA 2-thiouridine(34) synthase MnmA [Chlamydiota bacterium]|nr:tRNA 2-thiouridine(34) synthase MnmA [Chlamydiota bacterium]
MKTAVLLSGGVDSSVALCLLKEMDRYDLKAFYLKVWLEDELSSLGACPWEEDLQYVREVCNMLHVPFEVVSLQREYYQQVVENALQELRLGRTPSPDILCNRNIKFGEFLNKIDSEFTHVASGHYAQVKMIDQTYYLMRSPDPVKDQTYFLCSLSQSQLSRIIFPIGHLQKTEIRKLAAQYGLPNRDRKDSQGICFLGKIRYPEFIKFYLGERTGHIIEYQSGRRLGTHHGYWFYTIGQRQGLGLSGGPWFVVKKDLESNVIYVSHENSLLRSHHFDVSHMNWISGKPEKSDLDVKIRHTPLVSPCHIEETSGNAYRVNMLQDDQGIAPGQSAVFYDGEICLGGGLIN